jgi:hypothetical protein
VYYVPRAWLDERAPAVEEPSQPPVAAEPEPVDPVLARLAAIEAHLQALVTMAQRGQTRLPF